MPPAIRNKFRPSCLSDCGVNNPVEGQCSSSNRHFVLMPRSQQAVHCNRDNVCGKADWGGREAHQRQYDSSRCKWRLAMQRKGMQQCGRRASR